MDIDVTKRLCTRDARPVEIVSTICEVVNGRYRFPISARIPSPGDPSRTMIAHYQTNGRWKTQGPHVNDLVVAMFWHDILRSCMLPTLG